MAKAGKKLEAAQEAELTIQQKWELLTIVKHPRMAHVTVINILDAGNGKFAWSFSDGSDLKVKENMDPEKDAKVIATTGKKFRYVTLPGKYINRMKIVDTWPVEDFMQDEDAITEAYTLQLADDRKAIKAKMLDNPDATAEMLSELLKKATAKAADLK